MPAHGPVRESFYEAPFDSSLFPTSACPSVCYSGDGAIGPRYDRPTETEKRMAERIKARKTIILPTSHASIATRPDDIVQLIEEARNAVAARAA